MRTGKIDSKSMVTIANGIAVALSEMLSADEQNILGNLFSLVGASLSSIAAIEELNSETGNNEDGTE